VEPDSLSRKVGKEITTTRCVIAQKGAILMHLAAEARSCNDWLKRW